MKQLIPIFLFVGLLSASDLVTFNPNSSPVANRVTEYKLSQPDNVWRGVAGSILITNSKVQLGAGVDKTNFTSLCVVDKQQVRLMTKEETDRIAATNAILTAESIKAAELEQKAAATNTMISVEPHARWNRAMIELLVEVINESRTNKEASFTALKLDEIKKAIEVKISEQDAK